MFPSRVDARALFGAAAVALLAACAGGGSSLTPSTNLSPAVQPAAQAQSHTLTTLDEHRGSGDGDGGGSGGGGTMTFTLVNGLSADSSLNFNIYSKACDATIADAPTYTVSSFSALTLPKSIAVSDCNPANLSLTLPTTNDYIVLVDETQANAETAIAGPASETLGVFTFTPTVNPISLNKGDTYAFFIATGTSSGGGCGDDNDGKHKRSDGDRRDGGDGHGDGDGHGGDCHGGGDGHGDGDGHGHDR